MRHPRVLLLSVEADPAPHQMILDVEPEEDEDEEDEEEEDEENPFADRNAVARGD